MYDDAMQGIKAKLIYESNDLLYTAELSVDRQNPFVPSPSPTTLHLSRLFWAIAARFLHRSCRGSYPSVEANDGKSFRNKITSSASLAVPSSSASPKLGSPSRPKLETFQS
jgi:hypothetical protein